MREQKQREGEKVSGKFHGVEVKAKGKSRKGGKGRRWSKNSNDFVFN